jgi:hypothetical protein
VNINQFRMVTVGRTDPQKSRYWPTGGGLATTTKFRPTVCESEGYQSAADAQALASELDNMKKFAREAGMAQ